MAILFLEGYSLFGAKDPIIPLSGKLLISEDQELSRWTRLKPGVLPKRSRRIRTSLEKLS